MKKKIKLFFGILLLLFLLLQLYPRPEKNKNTFVTMSDIERVHTVTLPVQEILKKSCYDCHSNNTVYPWYASIQPVSLWLGNHIKDGKAELNFSDFGKYSLRRQYRKLGEINAQVKEDEMPLKSYTLIHRNAILSKEDKLILANWVTALKDSFQLVYPADSLRKK